MTELEKTDPLDPDVVECPWAYYRALREAGGVYRVPGRGFFLVSRYDTAMKVLKDTATFSSKAGVAVPRTPDGSHRPGPGEPVRTLLTADPPEHRKYRDLVNRAFSQKRVNSWEANIRAITDELIDGFIGAGRCELIYDFAVPLPLIVISDALGLPREHLRQFKQWSDGIARFGGLTTPEDEARIAGELAAFGAYVAGMIEDRRGNLGDDFVSDLIRARFDGERPLTLPELVSITMQFLVAGNETTTNTIASGMVLLLQHPDQMEAARADASLIPNLVEEVLRVEAPVQAHFRVAARDTELEGVAIPEGAGVGVVFGCANRDGAVFPDPETFDITRANAGRHLAFSQGIHYCPGAPLARAESVIAFEHLLRRLKNIRLDEADSDLGHVPSFTHRGLRKVALTFDPA
ncbi:MAG: cytochrome P450 [Sphingomonadales bacterium]